MSISKKVPRSSLFKNVSWVFLSNITIGIISFLSILYFNNILNLQEISKYAIISSTLEIAWAFINLGLNQYLIINPNNKIAHDNIIVLFFFQSFVIFIISISCILFFLDFDKFTLLSTLLLTVGKCFENLTTILYANDEANLNYKKISIYRSYSKLLGIAIGFILTFVTKNYFIFVYRDFSANIALFIFYYERKKIHLKLSFNKQEIKYIFNFIYKIYTLNILERITSKIDVIIIKSLWGSEFVGQYFLVKNIIDGILGFLLFPIQTVLYGFYCKKKQNITVIFKNIKYVTFSSMFFLFIILITTSFFSKKLENYFKNINIYFINGFLVYSFSILIFENLKVFLISQNISFIGITTRLFQLFVQILIYYFVLYNGINNFNFSILISFPFLLLVIFTLIITNSRISKLNV